MLFPLSDDDRQLSRPALVTWLLLALNGQDIDGGAGTDTAIVNLADGDDLFLDVQGLILSNFGFEIFAQNGPGQLTLQGQSITSGLYDLRGGTLFLNADVGNVDFALAPGTVLGGTGTLGSLSSTGGIVAPGNSIGTLTVNGDFTLDGASMLQIEADDMGGADLLVVNGAVTLGGATLDVMEVGAFGGADPFNYIIIDNDAADAVNGTFGTILNDFAFLTPTVSYNAGDGNDVRLSLTPNNAGGMEGCNPDPAVAGDDVVCTGTDSDGFSTLESDVDVLVQAGATVTSAGTNADDSTVIGLFSSANTGTITNNGTVRIDAPTRDQVTAIQFGADGTLLNGETGVIEAYGNANSDIINAGPNTTLVNNGTIRGAFTSSSTGVRIREGGTFENAAGGLIEVDLVGQPSGTSGVGTLTGVTLSGGDNASFTNFGTLRLTGPADVGQLVAVESINYANGFDLFQSGTIDNSGGLIKDLGATFSSFSPSDSTDLATITFNVLSPGDLDLSLRQSLSPFYDTTIFGKDGDQRAFSSFNETSLTLSAPLPDLAVTHFEISQPHASQGLVDINYQISNYGQADTEPFMLELHLSDKKDDFDPKNISASSLVWQQSFQADAITGMGRTDILQTQVQLPRELLYKHALRDDPVTGSGVDFGTNSDSSEWLHLVIQPSSDDADTLSMNNSRSDSFTYFPWDVDGNGRVSMSDAIEMINRIGRAPEHDTGHTQIHDLNGDQVIDQIETMAVIQRIGLKINHDVF